MRREFRSSIVADYDAFELRCDPSCPIETVKAVFDKVVYALALIEDRSPHLYRRLPRHVFRFLVKPYGGKCAYAWFCSACVLDVDVVESYPVEYVASLIVHESTHGRMRHWRGMSHPDRRRVELICTNAELRFLRRVAERGHDVQWWMEKLGERRAQLMRGGDARAVDAAGIAALHVADPVA